MMFSASVERVVGLGDLSCSPLDVLVEVDVIFAAPHLCDDGEDSVDGDGASLRRATLSTVWNFEISAAPPLDVLVGGSIEKGGWRSPKVASLRVSYRS